MPMSKQREWNMGCFRDTMKRPTLLTVGIEEGEECHGEDTVSISSKIIQETFPNLEKKMPIHVQEDHRTPIDRTRKRNSPYFS